MADEDEEDGESGAGERRFACKTRNMIVDRWKRRGTCSSTISQTREKGKERKGIKGNNERWQVHHDVNLDLFRSYN